MTSVAAPVIYTIGHGGGSFTDLERRLEPHRVGIIVDVRSQPWSSRAPDFTRDALEIHAAGAGLAYRWLGRSLGGRPSDPALSTADGDLADEEAAVASAPSFSAGLDEVEGLADIAPVVLLCAETDARRCHRATLIAPALIARGYHVHHIDADGVAEPHQDRLPG